MELPKVKLKKVLPTPPQDWVTLELTLRVVHREPHVICQLQFRFPYTVAASAFLLLRQVIIVFIYLFLSVLGTAVCPITSFL